jgi:hypothetical protein
MKFLKKEIEAKMVKLLRTISDLNIKPQTKLKIFAIFIPTQINFDLKIYSFAPTFISSVLDRLCTAHIRKWLEFPVSSCVSEWVSTPLKFCGLNIPTFAQVAERLLLSKRNALRLSKNISVRELWATSSSMANTKIDDLLCKLNFKGALKYIKDEQLNVSVSHFLGLSSQGQISKIICDTIFPKEIENWKKSIEQLPSFAHNFVRKAMTNQLPTLKNLKLWGCSNTDLCPRCGLCQSNKHVLSNCSAPEVLARYLERHNKILRLIVSWLKPKLNSTAKLYCDLSTDGTRHISDLFNGVRPDLAIVDSTKIDVLELTVCHETNLKSSRNFKLNKYANISSARSSLIRELPVRVFTIEVSTLGFTVIEPLFLDSWDLPKFSPSFLSDITKTVVLASHDIYGKR